jgi:hypothetical protein
MVVWARGRAYVASTPAGSGRISATALPESDAARASRLPRIVVEDSTSPVDESRASRVVDPPLLIVA